MVQAYPGVVNISGQQIGTGARMAEGMEEKDELREALETIRNVGDHASWLRDTPHYQAEASLPFAYALACVEVVCKSSEEAEIVHNKLVVLHVGLQLLTSARTSGEESGRGVLDCRESHLLLAKPHTTARQVQYDPNQFATPQPR